MPKVFSHFPHFISKHPRVDSIGSKQNFKNFIFSNLVETSAASSPAKFSTTIKTTSTVRGCPFNAFRQPTGMKFYRFPTFHTTHVASPNNIANGRCDHRL